MEDNIVFEPIGRVTMGQAQPIINMFAEMTLSIEGDRVLTYNPHRVIEQFDPDTQETKEIEQPGLEVVGKVKKTSSGKSYNLNVFGKTQIINAEQYEQLKARKVGGISSVTVSMPMQANTMPTGVKSAFKRATDGTQPAVQTRKERIQQAYSAQ